MENSIFFNHQKYFIIKKNIKNIYLRYKDGIITLSVPKFFTKNDILSFLSTNNEKINSFLEKRKLYEKNNLIENGGTVKFLGIDLNVLIKNPSSKNNRIYKIENTLVFECKNLKEEKETLLNSFYKKELSTILPKYIEKWTNITGITPNCVRLNVMKTRWGSCNSFDKRIWLNPKIMSKDLKCLDYLILHELTHILYKGHQKDFKDHLKKYMPNYKEIEKILKEE